jgi:hypothetical protein
MPTIIKNEAGEEVEVFSAEELQAKAQEVADAKVAEEREHMEAENAVVLAEKEAELLETQEKLQKLQDKDYNFSKVRDANKKDAAAQKKLEEDMASLRQEIAAISKQPIEEAKTDFLNKNIGANKELQDKFNIFYEKLGANVKSRTEAQMAMEQAFMLANDGKKPDNGGRMQHTNVNDNFADLPEGTESETSKDIGKRMGLSTEDKKKYAGKVDWFSPNVGVK